MLNKTENGGSRPVPDPTVLTTQQLLGAVAAAKELFSAKSEASDAAIVHEKELREEKFRSIAVQFAERDTRTEQTSRDNKVAVDAAFQAAKEAVAEQNRSSALAISKSEAATTKQIDAQATLIGTATTALDGKISDVKDRITALEGHTRGASDSMGWIIGVVGALAAVVMAIVMTARH